MRLPGDKVKEAILHPDQDVREAAVYYFAHSFSLDPTVMLLAIQAIERFGWQDAFQTYAFFNDLVQSDETVRWFIRQLEQASTPESEEEAEWVVACVSALVHATPALLRRHEAEITDLDALDQESKDAIAERIWFPSRPAQDLWNGLEDFCRTAEEYESDLGQNYHFGCRIVAALATHPDQFGEKVLAILCGDTGDFDNVLESLAVRLAGEMKLEATVPFLIEMLNDPGDWMHEECARALTKIGTEAIVLEFAKQCPQGGWNMRMSASCILEDIHTDLSVQTCLDLLKTEEDHEIRSILLQSVLFNFSTEGIEPARQFILNTPLDPYVLEVRSALLIACKMMGERFPEFGAWLEDSKNDTEFRRKWHEEHPLPGEEDEEDESAEEDFEEPASPLTTYVRRVRRNDPCPCGSGKLFKNCCYERGQPVETDLSNAAAMRGIRPPPKYPMATVALYGPDDKTTTKIAAAVFKRDGAKAIIERWMGTNIKENPKAQQQMTAFFEKHGVESIVMTSSNMG